MDHSSSERDGFYILHLMVCIHHLLLHVSSSAHRFMQNQNNLVLSSYVNFPIFYAFIRQFPYQKYNFLHYRNQDLPPCADDDDVMSPTFIGYESHNAITLEGATMRVESIIAVNIFVIISSQLKDYLFELSPFYNQSLHQQIT